MGAWKKFFPQSLALLILLPSSLLAAIIRVPQNQPTISAAVIAAASHDTVLVAPGTYTENVIINGKNLNLLSEAGPTATIITPITTTVPVIRILNTDATTSLEGFTIQNGRSGDVYASGMRLSNSSATVRNNIFRNNNGACVSLGVAIWADGGSPTVENNIFKGNSGCGRTIEFVNSSPLLIRNLIIENSAQPVVFVVGNITALNNTLARNNSTGTGIELNGGSGNQRISNNIIANNTGYGIANAGSQTIITYNDFFNNGLGPVSGGVLGTGNLNTDPIFIGGSPFDYQLQVNSPCIDAGDPSTTVPPFGGSRVDIGAFEFRKELGLFTPRDSTALKKPQFIWSLLRDSTGSVIPASFRVVLATGCDFGLADSSPVLRDTVWKFPYKLTVGLDYCWKMIVFPDVGDTTIVTDSVHFVVKDPLLTLILPVNNSTLKVRRPSFTWNSISDTSIPESFTYQVVFSTDSAFGAAETSGVLSGTAWKAEQSLAVNQPHYWKVAAAGSDWDTVISNSSRFSIVNPPLAPILPLNNSTLKIRRPTFSWNSVGDTSIPELFSYQVLFSTDNAFGVAESSAIISDTMWKMDRSLVVGQSYYWKVVATGDGGDTITSAVSKFTVTGSISLFLPANFATLKVRQPTFIWQPVSDTSILGPFSYHVFLAKDSNFISAEVTPPLADTVWKVGHVLDANQTYFWKIIAVSGSGDTAFSSPAKFTIAPIPFVLHLPASTVRIKQPTFAWQRVTDTSITGSYTYKTILSKTSDFALAETSVIVTDTVWKVPHKLELYNTYYWKVESILSGVGSSFNNAASFAVSPPSIFPLLPSEGATARVRQPTLVWSTVKDTSIPDTFLYQARISKEDFSNAMISPVQNDTSWQVNSPLQAGTIYVWTPMAFYSNDDDTIFPDRSSFFRDLPSRIIIPDDRPKIQDGIDLVLDGDTVWVKPGTYYENIFFKGKRVKVISAAGPESTTIAKYVDGLQLVNFGNSEDATTLLSGFTITGATQVSNGAAIKVVNASPRIENNHIVGNWGDYGAIFVQNGFPTIQRNLIAHNTGAAAINYSGSSGGDVLNCTISDNSGDGIRVTPSIPIQVTNCIISFNAGYGIRSVTGSNTSSSITYDDVFGNTLGHFFAILPSTSNINVDPLFLDGSPFSYRLSSASPCIDAGDPASPVPAGGGPRSDMGAFEFFLTRGDLNGDGVFGPVDVVLEMNCAFLGTGNCNLAMTDLDCDSQLSGSDVVLILNFVFLGIPLPC